MRVIHLQAENFKRLRAVDITPDETVQVIAGKNAQGKTSVLDAIWAALGGAKVSPERPIRDGQKEAKVTLDLGELKVTRTWHGEKSSLVVENASGGRLPSPQAVLDTLVGKLAFDPLAFAQADDKAQLKMLLEVVELPFSPEELAARRKALYDQRTDVNRDVRRLEGALASMPQHQYGAYTSADSPDLPDEEVKVADLVLERDRIRRLGDDFEQLLAEWHEVDAEIARLVAKKQDIEQAGATASQLLADAGGKPRAEALERQIEQADEINAMVRAKRERATAEAELTAVKQESESLTGQIDQLDDYKQDCIEAAQMPVAGLGFTDEGVTLNGVPFSQASAAERLRTSTAIAMAKNPQVKVILIRDGSLLDSENLALIGSMAAEHGFQLWIEKVDETGSVGIIIEDGEVR